MRGKDQRGGRNSGEEREREREKRKRRGGRISEHSMDGLFNVTLTAL